MAHQLITQESFTSIQDAQAGLTKVFAKASQDGNFVRVLKNNKSLGVLLPNRIFDSLIEDLEALSSPNYRASIETARNQKKRYSLTEFSKEHGL